MEELKFDKETAEGLYRIFCGLSTSCYENAEVYDEAKSNMKKAFQKVLDWGRKSEVDIRGGQSKRKAVIPPPPPPPPPSRCLKEGKEPPKPTCDR